MLLCVSLFTVNIRHVHKLHKHALEMCLANKPILCCILHRPKLCCYHRRNQGHRRWCCFVQGHRQWPRQPSHSLIGLSPYSDKNNINSTFDECHFARLNARQHSLLAYFACYRNHIEYINTNMIGITTVYSSRVFDPLLMKTFWPERRARCRTSDHWNEMQTQLYRLQWQFDRCSSNLNARTRAACHTFYWLKCLSQAKLTYVLKLVGNRNPVPSSALVAILTWATRDRFIHLSSRISLHLCSQCSH